MATLNKVQIIGNLGRDPETKAIGDKTVTEFSIAVNRRWRVGAEIKEEVTWFQVEAWNQIGEVCARHLKKGHSAFIEGRIKIDAWTSDSGRRERVVIVASDVQFLNGNGCREDDTESAEDATC